MKSKQAERNAAKRAQKKASAEDETAPVSASGPPTPAQLVDKCKEMLQASCLLTYAPKIVRILQEEGLVSGGRVREPKEEKTEEKTEETTEETTEEKPAAEKEEKVEIFDKLKARFVWHNPLGLEATADDSMAAWLSLKGQQLDMGPRKAKKGTPKMDRIMTNVCNNLPQYAQIFLVLMMLQAFLFRSYFACLPWLVGYQFASVYVPLKTMEAVPQVPLSEIPLQARIACTMGIHALVWLFFAYEAIWRCNFFIEFLAIGGIIFHAFAAAPVN